MLAAKLVAGLAVVAVGLTTASSHQAVTETHPTPAAVTAAGYADGLQRLESALVRNPDGTFALPASASDRAGVSSAVYARISGSLNQTNDLIRAGALRSTTDNRVYLADQSPVYATQGGVNGLFTFWWGDQLKLDAGWTDRLLDAMRIGSAIAGVLAAAGITSVPSAIIFAILAVGSTAIAICKNDNGVTIWLPAGGPPWCGGQ